MGTRSGWARTIMAALGLMSASMQTGCASEKTVDPALATRSQAAVAQVRVLVPAGSDLSTAPPTTTAFMNLKDRSSIRSTSNVALPLTNLGTAGTQVGLTVTSGSITSGAPVLLRSGTIVQGNVTSAGTVTSQSNVTVTGQITQNATIPPPAEFVWDVPLAGNPGNPKTVNPDAVLTLAPGAYGKLTVYSRGRVNLSSGVYAFSDMQVEPDAKLRFDINPANGPVALYVDKVTWMRGTLETTNATHPTSKSVLFVYRGTTVLRFERTANMAVVAPAARVEFGTGGTIYQGSVFAQGLVLDPDVRLTYLPFSYWDWVLPAKPLPGCVMPAGIGKYMAAFGYQNGRGIPLTTPHGPRNRFVPASARGLFPPTTLASGLHEQAVWVDMPATGVTWELMGHTATADLNSPACELPEQEGPVAEGPGPAGASLPSRSLPHAPSFNLAPNAANRIGPGTFVDPTTPEAGWGTTPVPPEVPLTPTAPIAIPNGLVVTPPPPPPRKVRVHVTMNPQNDPPPERIIVKVESRGPSQTFPTEVVVEESAGCACCPILCLPGIECCASPINLTYEKEFDLPADQAGQVDLWILEQNGASDTEADLIAVRVGLNGAVHIEAESGPTENNVFGSMSSIQNSMAVNTGFDQTVQFIDYASNEVFITVTDLTPPPTPLPTGDTLVCVDWTGYFVDATVASQTLREVFTGETVDAMQPRLRAHDAAYAKFQLRARGAYATFATLGFLDVDGCTTVPSVALTYQEGVPRGSAGGVVLQVTLEGDLEQPTPQGPVNFDITDPDGTRPVTEFGFNEFDQGTAAFTLQDGLRVPPARIDVAGTQFDHKTTVAATISRGLQEMERSGTFMPPAPDPQPYPENNIPQIGVYAVKVDEGSTTTGDRDHLCQHVPSSAASGLDLLVGPGHFPCDVAGTPRACTQTCTTNDGCAQLGLGVCSNHICSLPSTATECRKSCVQDGDCPGGQHCADGNDHDLGCSGGGACFCAYPGQGTFKYVTAHELGHVVQQAFLGGRTSEGYLFDCPESDDPNVPPPDCALLGRLDGGRLIDPAGMDPLCGCQHVPGTNSRHCLQSVERTHMAQTEGYGQYFAAKVWNGTPGTQCLFNYYKEFLETTDSPCRGAACRPFAAPLGDTRQFHVNEVPIPFDCNAPRKWRNAHGCGVDPLNPTAMPNTFAQGVGTEYDWMTFLRGLEQGGIAFHDMMSIYNHACHPENQQFDAGGTALPICAAGQSPDTGCYAPTLLCGDWIGYLDDDGNPVRDLPTYWLDRLAAYDPVENPAWPGAPVFDRGGFLDGARRKWGELDPRTVGVDVAGDAHGVSEDVTP